MEVVLRMKDEGAKPGTFICEASIAFDIDLAKALKVLKGLQERDIPAVVAKAWTESLEATDPVREARNILHRKTVE